jgi:hypothetical protein
MSYIKTNETLSNQINAALGYYSRSQAELFNDIEQYRSKALGFRKFKSKWKYFFDIRKQISNKSINTRASLVGLLNRLSNPKHFSNINFIKDFQRKMRNAWINVDFINLRMKFHKDKTVLTSVKVPANFKGKTSYFYSFRKKKVGLNGFLNNHSDINNWNDIKNRINVDLNIVANTLKLQKPNEKLLFGFKLWMEIYDDSTNTYIPDITKGIQCQKIIFVSF